ncbi:hypothetical protein GOBAR_AA30716 [Gossypium barbadense]|uniref:Uncharacterized protein n=1 Tax=Gossypium barbadense TaxID=3634 RepID=A0A2P5WFW9_GOSBA|nr:hypothetical protein GOBAR_AA30716 [Gossypium barbadense]
MASHHGMAHAADGVRGYRTTGGQRCRRLLLQNGRDKDDSFIVGYRTCNGIRILPLGLGRDRDDSFIIRYRTCNGIQILPFGIGEGLVVPFCTSRDGSPEHHRDGSSEHCWEPNRWWGAPTFGHAISVGSALDNVWPSISLPL